MPEGALGNRPWPEPPLAYMPAIRRENVRWPDGNHLAVIVYVNVEYFQCDLPSPMALTPGQADRTPDIINYTWRDYGIRVGIWRVIDALDKHGIKPTIVLNSEVCRAYPIVVEEFVKRDWEVADHGVTNSIHLYGLSADQQRAMIREMRPDHPVSHLVRPRAGGCLQDCRKASIRLPCCATRVSSM
jgi:hypothetical protein